jgi:hypothetical protein
MTAPARSGCTGIGPAQPGSWIGWAGVLDGAGVLTAPVLAEGVVLTLAADGPSGAVSRAA